MEKIEAGDRDMHQTVLNGGIAQAMRAMAEREVLDKDERYAFEAEQSNVVGFQPR